MKKMITLFITVALVLTGGMIYVVSLQNQLDNALEEVEFQVNKNEALQNSNRQLTEDNEFLGVKYQSLRNELWNLKNNLEREQAEY